MNSKWRKGLPALITCVSPFRALLFFPRVPVMATMRSLCFLLASSLISHQSQPKYQPRPSTTMEMDIRPPPTTVYKHQAKAYLCDLFPRISCRAIGIVFEHHAFNFTNAFRVLTQIHGTDRNEIGTVFAFERGVKVFILKDRVKKNTKIRDPVLLADLARIDELANTKENNRPAKNDDEDDDKKIKSDKILLECGCCFGEYGPDNMVHCSADIDHLVCQECLYNHVSEQVDGKNSADTPCIILHNCAGQYQIAQLDKFLSPKLKSRFHERKFLAVLSDAGMEDVW